MKTKYTFTEIRQTILFIQSQPQEVKKTIPQYIAERATELEMPVCDTISELVNSAMEIMYDRLFGGDPECII